MKNNDGALYIVDLRAVDDPRRISDYFASALFGKTAHERNLGKLIHVFGHVKTVVLCRDDAAKILHDQEQGSETVQPYRVYVEGRNLDSLSLDHEAFGQNAVIFYQAGLGLIEDVRGLHIDGQNVRTLDGSLKTPVALLSFLAHDREAAPDGAARGLSCKLVTTNSGTSSGANTIIVSQAALAPLEGAGQDLLNAMKSRLHALSSQRSLDGPVARNLMRPLSGVLGEIFSNYGVHPNTVTILGAAFAIAALPLFADGGLAPLAIGGVFWFLSALMDVVDGEVARLQDRQSTFGAWLDLTFDRLLDGAVIVAIYWPHVQSHDSAFLHASVFTSIICIACSSYIGLLYDAWMKTEFGRRVYFRIGRDTRNAIIIGGALLGFRLETIWLVGGLAAFETARRLWVCWIWEQKRSRRLESVSIG